MRVYSVTHCNSLYGAMGSRYFIFFTPEMAEAITTNGQLIVSTAAEFLNRHIRKVLDSDEDFVTYIDTDSCYISLEAYLKKIYGDNIPGREDNVEEIMDKICAGPLTQVLKSAFEMITKRLNCYTNVISMKREKLYDRAIFTSKKHYLINTWNSEGVRYETPKISMTGIEAVKSSTPEVCKKKFNEAFKILMEKTEKDLQNFLQEWESKFKQLSAEDVGRNLGVNSYNDYVRPDGSFKDRIPMQVRAAATYNRMIKEAGIDGKYETIQAGDKVKVIHLKMPNPSMENVIAFPGVLPRELGLDEFIDYKMQFDKVFLSPLKTITDVISWETEKKTDLSSFFS